MPNFIKTLEKSRNRAFVSSTFSKELYISVVMTRGWLMVESPGIKADWLGVIRLFNLRNVYSFSKIIFSKILLHMHRREIG